MDAIIPNSFVILGITLVAGAVFVQFATGYSSRASLIMMLIGAFAAGGPLAAGFGGEILAAIQDASASATSAVFGIAVPSVLLGIGLLWFIAQSQGKSKVGEDGGGTKGKIFQILALANALVLGLLLSSVGPLYGIADSAFVALAGGIQQVIS